MPGARARTGDLTGRIRAEQQAAHEEELAARADEIALATEVASKAAENEVLDYSKGSAPVILDTVVSPVEVSEEWRVIRTNEDIDDMTFGVGNNYSFRAGQKAKVPVAVADHLEEKGYIWH